MRRLALAMVALGACASPPAAVMPTTAAPSTSTTASSSTTTTTEAPATTTSTTTDPPTTVTPATTAPAPATTVARSSTGAGGSTSVSWYGDESGSHTANGDRYNPDGLTFAHRSLPYGAEVRFCRGGTCVVATCTDRGPASWTGRDFDLSRGTFGRLAPLSAGVATVTWERLA